MEGAVLARKTLADDFGILVDQNGHETGLLSWMSVTWPG
jgi:hypothetical protein